MPDSPAALFDALLEIMARLRGPGGCPWDREQTPTSLKPFLIEEAYEVLEAIESGVADAVEEELGDLLFQVLFHARLAEETGTFSIADVLARLARKMVHRHPHVFGDATVGDARSALAQWEVIKQAEAAHAGKRRSVIDGVPRSLPSLLRAQRMQSKASRIGFDWPDAPAAWKKVREEIMELDEVIEGGDRGRLQDELGDALFSLVNVARLSGMDAEEALQGAIEKFRRRFTAVEAELDTADRGAAATGPEELDRLWELVKARERDTDGRAR
jgi:tetrapyrrole methylase family protein/MazG family protein